ncbi:MAG: hypothetical protein ACI970_001267 [Myxococcota bacterium]|jgi:hypothetical protein
MCTRQSSTKRRCPRRKSASASKQTVVSLPRVTPVPSGMSPVSEHPVETTGPAPAAGRAWLQRRMRVSTASAVEQTKNPPAGCRSTGPECCAAHMWPWRPVGDAARWIGDVVRRQVWNDARRTGPTAVARPESTCSTGNAFVESTNTKLGVIHRRAFGLQTPEPMTALGRLGPRRPLPRPPRPPTNTQGSYVTTREDDTKRPPPQEAMVFSIATPTADMPSCCRGAGADQTFIPIARSSSRT